jgi:hypothetical protein
MTTNTKVEITCDFCKKDIDLANNYVNAGVYGRDFHIGCVEEMSADTLIWMLDLDIKVMRYDDWQNAVKAPMFFRGQNAS